MFKNYRNLEKHILILIAAEFFLQLVNAAFMLVLNLYMSKKGFPDFIIAEFVSYRFMGVLLLAFPIGLMIKGRKLKIMFVAAGILLPSTSLLIIHAVDSMHASMLYAGLTLWGVSFTCMQVCILPYILRNARPDSQSEAISLNYATFSLSTIICGIVIYVLNLFDPVFFNEKTLLQLFSILGYGSLILLLFLSKPENVPVINTKRSDLKDFDWVIILKALTPTMIIATGAGLTIPFINLFFYHVHGIDTEDFAFIGSVASVLVFIAALAIPLIRRKYGYSVAVTLFQSMAIVALIIMASTEFFSGTTLAVYIAVVSYMFRQPLMNMAGPVTSELVMNYAGKRNQEMVSALTSAIWSGSWFISSQLFKQLREAGLDYVYIIYITALIYTIGVIWYHFLITDFNRMQVQAISKDLLGEEIIILRDDKA
jgi:hypothetical protein